MRGGEDEAVGDEGPAANVVPPSVPAPVPSDGGHPGEGADGSALAVGTTRHDPLDRVVDLNISPASRVGTYNEALILWISRRQILRNSNWV